jgi:hypothetical protein
MVRYDDGSVTRQHKQDQDKKNTEAHHGGHLS